MYRIKNGNIERIVDSKEKCNEYVAKGFALLDQAVQTTPDMRDRQLSEMSVEELVNFAEGNDIDIGKASSAEGILKKITEFLGGDDHGNDKGGKAENPTGDNDQ